MRWISLGVMLVAGSLCAADAAAQDWRELVMQQLDKGGEVMRSAGQTDANVLARNQMVGLIEDGASSYIEMRLDAGIEYLISGACDQDCSDLDLRLLRSEDFEVVESDIEDDDVPIVTFTPPASALYLLAVDMADCSENVCYYGFRVYQE